MLWKFGAGVFVLALGGLFAQSSVRAPEFAAASVKQDKVGTDEGPAKGREIIQTNPGSLTMQNIRLSSALRWAYGIQPNQISGAAGIDSERYVILAKADSPVPDQQLRLMLRKLLADRFKLIFHWETKEIPVYAIVVDNRGPKFKPSPDGSEGSTHYGKGNSVVAERATLSQFADSLTNPLRTVVLDETGLTGRYDFTLDLNVYEPGSIAPEDMPSLINRGLKDELGLKLESRKSKIRVLIIDHAEKVPIEN
jgi:uncharacterized protein (TIGR03435 family)